MKFSSENNSNEDHQIKFGFLNGSLKEQIFYVIIALATCWLPLAIYTLIKGTFWTGYIETSFITNFDTQARFLIAMPVLIFSEQIVTQRLGVILRQFTTAGFVHKEDYSTFNKIINSKVKFIRSNWTNLFLFALCYIHVILVIFYESKTAPSVLSWQMMPENVNPELNLAGKWSVLISRPILLFLFYRWFLWVIIWGLILKKISNLNINIYPLHPDLSGGLGFLGYSIRYFSPFAFAFTVTVAGVMIDYILKENMPLVELKYFMATVFILLTLLFTIPLLSFSWKLTMARDQSVFDNNDFVNGIFRELRKKLLKDFNEVSEKDLLSVEYSAASDLSALINNSLNMRFVPFTLKDFIPLWITIALPFLVVVLVKIPLDQILKQLLSIII